MAICPFAKQKLIPKWNKVRMTNYRRMNLHVAVSEQSSIYSMFSNSNIACSHFYIAKDGTIEQYIDTRYRSASDFHGNDSTISVETQGGVKNPETEPWTDAQFNAIVKLWIWARDTHNLKNRMATNTNTTENSLGLSWHRLGVDGNFSNRKGILSISYKNGGILYSKAKGKICPGDAKILQIPEIFKASNGEAATKPAGKPVPPSKPNTNKPPIHKPSTQKPKYDKNIANIQEALKLTGDYRGIIDGDNGSMTKNAIKSYQRRQKIKLVADGVWGAKTQAHYKWVIELQKSMNKWKGSKLVVDGDYGNLTARRVLELQQRNRGGAYKGYPDGVAGPIFLKMLGMGKYPN